MINKIGPSPRVIDENIVNGIENENDFDSFKIIKLVDFKIARKRIFR